MPEKLAYELDNSLTKASLKDFFTENELNKLDVCCNKAKNAYNLLFGKDKDKLKKVVDSTHLT